MRETLWALIAPLLSLLSLPFVDAFECYKSDGVALEFRSQYCNPVIQPYCLKANVYDGRVIRDCASAQQCPQGDSCTPITYDQDGTTDYVCCCSNIGLCNSSPTHFNSVLATTLALISTAVLKHLHKYLFI